MHGVLQTCEDSLEEMTMFQFKAVSQRRVLITDFLTQRKDRVAGILGADNVLGMDDTKIHWWGIAETSLIIISQSLSPPSYLNTSCW